MQRSGGVRFLFRTAGARRSLGAPGADNRRPNPKSPPRHPRVVVTRSILGASKRLFFHRGTPFSHLPAAGRRRFRIFRRPEDAVFASPPFWDQVWPQKLTLLILFRWSPGGYFYNFLSDDCCDPSPLKFYRFGLCAKKPHTSCDPQKPMDFHVFSIFSRRRKARSKARNRGHKWYRKRHPTCHNKSSFFYFSPLGLQHSQNLQK